MQAESSSDAVIAGFLAKLWPHRVHESGAIRSLLCHFGMHRWAGLPLEALLAGREVREVRFCRWCDKVKLDGVIH